MSTKNSPGTFDCYAKAAPNEPMFVLLGRDPVASMTVQLWRILRLAAGDNFDSMQIQEAEQCAEHLANWAIEHGKEGKVREVMGMFQLLMIEFHKIMGKTLDDAAVKVE